MNFSPFTTQFGTISANTVNQFAAAKLVQNITTANGQVVGLVSGGEGVHYLRPMDSNTQFTQQGNTNTLAQQGYITLPLSMPGDKPGDAQQNIQIQILNPNLIQQSAPKFQMGQMQIPIQNFHQDTTVLTVAYSPQEGEILQNHSLGEAMTIVAAIQPQDLPLLAQVQQQQTQTHHHHNQESNDKNEDSNSEDNNRIINIKTEPVWQNTVPTTTADLSEYFSRLPQALPLNLHHFLKFNTDIKETTHSEDSPAANGSITDDAQNDTNIEITENAEGDGVIIESAVIGGNGKIKKKRKYKKKPPKPKKPKPGQVHIALALDGTALYCCPECHMAYPEKENLEQHLSVHKIERRFICDICGAGLKRKEHLERHKSGHNPDRPYTCSVCMKGFKRKEHLNLHFVIHSGAKTEICGECGKGFYRKDHLRKHAKSHATKRLKEEMSNASANAYVSGTNSSNQSSSQESTNQNDKIIQTQNTTTICLPEVTIHVPTSNNQTLPVQIQLLNDQK